MPRQLCWLNCSLIISFLFVPLKQLIDLHIKDWFSHVYLQYCPSASCSHCKQFSNCYQRHLKWGKKKAYGMILITHHLGGGKRRRQKNYLKISVFMRQHESMVPFLKLLKYNLELQGYCSKRRAESMISYKLKAYRKSTKKISEGSQSYQKE